LAKVGTTRNRGDEGGFYDEEVFEKNRSSIRKDVGIFMIDKISPFPFAKEGSKRKAYFTVYPQECLKKQIFMKRRYVYEE